MIDLALYDVAFRMIGPLITLNELTGRTLERDGNNSLGGAPTGHFRTREGASVCFRCRTMSSSRDALVWLAARIGLLMNALIR